MLRSIMFAAALLAGTSPALAQPAPAEGMVDEPCRGLTVPIPAPVMAYLTDLYSAGRTGAMGQMPPEGAEFRKAQAEARKSDWPDLCRYREDNQRLRAGPSSGRRIVFIGDSITQNWGIADPAFFSGGVVNRGISGQTSPQILLRFQADVVALKPRVVHIMAGTNDLAGNTGPNSAEDYRNNIRTMVAIAKANRIRVILASIPPAAGFTWKPALKPAPMLAELNAWLKSYARAEKIIFLDYHGALATPGGALRADLTFDGVHPNHAGYQVMEPLVRKALAGS